MDIQTFIIILFTLTLSIMYGKYKRKNGEVKKMQIDLETEKSKSKSLETTIKYQHDEIKKLSVINIKCRRALKKYGIHKI